MSGDLMVLYAPRNRFLAPLAEGWQLPFVVEPMLGSHGEYSILLERLAEEVERDIADFECWYQEQDQRGAR